MNNNEVFERLASGDVDALDLLRERCPTIERRWKKVCKDIEALLRDVEKEFPDACIYTGSGGFNLLIGHSHGGKCSDAQQQMIALRNGGRFVVGDGDW